MTNKEELKILFEILKAKNPKTGESYLDQAERMIKNAKNND